MRVRSPRVSKGLVGKVALPHGRASEKRVRSPRVSNGLVGKVALPHGRPHEVADDIQRNTERFVTGLLKRKVRAADVSPAGGEVRQLPARLSISQPGSK